MAKPSPNIQINYSHPIANGIIHCWLFNEFSGEATDIALGNNGTLNGTVSRVASSLHEKVLSYTASSDYVSAAHSSRLKSATNFSIVMGLKPDDLSNTSRWIFQQWDNTTDGIALFQYNGAYLVFEIGSFTDRLEVTDIFSNLNWMNIVATKNNNNLALWKNGVFKDGGSRTTVNTLISNIGIGGPNGLGGVAQWIGQISYVYVFERTLSPEEIQALNNNPYCFISESTPAITKNFSVASVSSIYSANTGVIDLTTNHGLKLPSTIKPFYAEWWNSTDYPDPTDDPNREVVKVYKKQNDKLFIQRGCQGTIPSDKNLVGKTYKLAQFFDEDKINKQLFYFKNPSRGSYFFHDFENAATFSAGIFTAFDTFTFDGAGNASLTVQPAELNHSGIISINSGNSGSGRGFLNLGSSRNMFRFGQYDIEVAYWFKLPNLNGENGASYEFGAGFNDTTSSPTSSTDGAIIYYTGTSQKNWKFAVYDAGVRTLNDDLGVPVKSNVWYELRIKTCKENICKIYLNKTLLKKYIGVLPTSATNLMTASIGISQDSATGSVLVDAVETLVKFRNERTVNILNS